MAAVSTTITTAGTTLAKLYRKVQGNLGIFFAKNCAEYGWIQGLPAFDLDMSAREVTQPVVLSRQGGGAFILEDGYESVPRTVAPVEATYTFSQYNDRFAISMLARMLDQNAKGKAAQLNRQIGFQTLRMAEGMARRFTYTFYGFSSGLVCQTSTDATSSTQTLTLINAFGLTDTASDNAAYLAKMFANGDRIAVVR